MFTNDYYVVEKPFQVFRHVGLSPSHIYLARSRVINTVMAAINTRPGDEIHAMVGGTFLKREGEVHPLSLRPPLHPFEKSHDFQSDGDRLATRAKLGFVNPIPAPAAKPDYHGAR